MTDVTIMIACLLLCSLPHTLVTPSVRVPFHGLEETINLIKALLDDVRPIKHLILSGTVDRSENQSLHITIITTKDYDKGCVELVMTDFGFHRYPSGVHLILRRR